MRARGYLNKARFPAISRVLLHYAEERPQGLHVSATGPTAGEYTMKVNLQNKDIKTEGELALALHLIEGLLESHIYWR
jgi:hypothetical protein